MTTPRRFCVLFRTGTPDQQLLSQATRAWFAAEKQKNPALNYDPDGQTKFEVIPHFFSTTSDVEFHECVRTNADYMSALGVWGHPDTMFFHQGVVMWPSGQEQSA